MIGRTRGGRKGLDLRYPLCVDICHVKPVWRSGRKRERRSCTERSSYHSYVETAGEMHRAASLRLSVHYQKNPVLSLSYTANLLLIDLIKLFIAGKDAKIVPEIGFEGFEPILTSVLPVFSVTGYALYTPFAK